MQHNNIKKDYFWNTLGVLAQTAISPLLLIVITRINGIYDSGLFSFAFSMSLIFYAFGIWGGRTYQVSDVKREFSHRSYIFVRLILGTFMIIGALVFAFTNGYDAIKTGIILTLVLFKVAESIADSIYGVIQVHDKLFIAGKSLIFKSIGGFTTFMLIDLLTGSILLGSLGIVLVNVLLIIFYDLRIARRLESINIGISQLSRHTKDAVLIMKRTAPVFAVAFLSMFSLNIPRYFIDKYHGDEIGHFGIIAMPITVIVLLMSFILQPNVVNLSKLYAEKKYTEFNAIVKRLSAATSIIGALVLAGMFLVGVPVFNFVFGVDFSNYRADLMIMTAGGIANALVAVFINILIIMRHFKDQFYTLVYTNILLAIISAIVISPIGMLVGISLFAAVSLVQVLILAIIYKRILKKAQT